MLTLLSVSPGSDAQKPSSKQLLMALPAAVCFALLVCSLVCRGCHLWTRLFPPVPTPSSNLGDLLAMSYEKAGSQDTETVVISYVDEPAAETLEHTEF
nr:interleukin-5 receptor subunit alpha isoform X3 [Oryctolagus cuniculus]